MDELCAVVGVDDVVFVDVVAAIIIVVVVFVEAIADVEKVLSFWTLYWQTTGIWIAQFVVFHCPVSFVMKAQSLSPLGSPAIQLRNAALSPLAHTQDPLPSSSPIQASTSNNSEQLSLLGNQTLNLIVFG